MKRDDGLHFTQRAPSSMKLSHATSQPRSRTLYADRDWTRLMTPSAMKRERGALCTIALGLAAVALISAVPALFMWLEFVH